ncbi:hypothetical protein DID96_35180 [Burkholderia sp. Bp8963]|nr:hypothetical protein DID96_35180 [Burkholderia sp. Bp8963]
MYVASFLDGLAVPPLEKSVVERSALPDVRQICIFIPKYIAVIYIEIPQLCEGEKQLPGRHKMIKIICRYYSVINQVRLE